MSPEPSGTVWYTAAGTMRPVLALAILATLLLGWALPVTRVLLAGCVLLAPGYLLYRWPRARLRLPLLAGIGTVVGLSLSVIPILFLWTSTLGLRLSPLILRLMLIGAVLAAGLVLQKRPILRPAPPWLSLGLLFVALATLALRLYQIRDVALPLWVDSVHHALLIRVVGETGQMPISLRPYVEVDLLPYHWGYHAVAATWHTLAGLDLPMFMLLSGQIVNALHVLTIYTLGTYLLRSPLAGLWAALITGLLSMMPAYYVTWGRYTQLTGLLLLPALIVLSSLLVERPRFSPALLLCSAIALAGMILTHYIVLIFYAAWMAPYFLLLAFRRPRRAPTLALRLAALFVAALVLVAPWARVLFERAVLPVVRQPGLLAADPGSNPVDPKLLWTTNSQALYSLAALGVLIAAARRNVRVLALGLWIGVMFVMANPAATGVRALWLINNHTVIITLFVPVSLLAAYSLRELLRLLARWLPARLQPSLRLAGAVCFVLLAGYGSWQFRDVINPETNLTSHPDRRALDWVAANTSPDSRFLIGSAPWLGQVYRGTDAGWWLTPFAGRWTTTPPVLYDYGQPEYVRDVSARTAAVANLKLTDARALDDIISANHITHVFIGTKPGPLKGEMFWGNPRFKPVYDRDGVLIFEVQPV